jgi:hypothetical protein
MAALLEYSTEEQRSVVRFSFFVDKRFQYKGFS